MFFRFFCGLWRLSNTPRIFSNILPLSTSASIQGKSSNTEKIGSLTSESLEPHSNKKKLEDKKCCEKHKSTTLSNLVEAQKDRQQKDGNMLNNNTNDTSLPAIQKPQNRVRMLVTNKNFQKTNDNNTDNRRSTDLVSTAIEQLAVKKSTDWGKVRHFVLENKLNRHKYTTQNLDSNVVGYCMSIERYDLAYSYFKYISEQKIKPNLATLAKYLKVLYHRNLEKCSKQDEDAILALYKEICKEYPVLESSTLNGLILAMSVTKEWRKTLELLEELKRLTTPSKAAYSAIAAAMFANKELSAWALLDEMLQNDKIPDSVVFLSYLRGVKRLRKPENIIENLEKMFNFFKDSEIRCQEDVANQILEICRKNFVVGANVMISLQGYCQNCSKKLEKSEITKAEFEQLKQKFMNNVILGKDLFLKTDPTELSKFKDFLGNMEKFDVVLDGLNIAHSTGDKNPHVMAKLLCSVVRHYRDNNMSVLILGRVHMKNWPKDSWKYILENSSVFLTRNISQDDPYLLYCALNSGKNTIIVTRDLMRSHKFLLKDSKFKRLFQKWLDQRQHILLTVGKNDQPIFKKPPDFSPISQKNGEVWHIPYESSIEGINEHFHKTWLCLNLK